MWYWSAIAKSDDNAKSDRHNASIATVTLIREQRDDDRPLVHIDRRTYAVRVDGRGQVDGSLRPARQPASARLPGQTHRPGGRANAAQLNSFEAFPAFAAAVLVAQYTHAPQHTIDLLAIAWVALRLIYGVLYIANLAALRSLVWFGGVACVVGLFIAAA